VTALIPATDPALAASDDLALARSIVATCEAGHPDVARHRRHILEFVDQHPDALLRSCVDGHLTGSALVVEEGSGRILVLFHRKLQRWLQPGGHADGDANLASVALREATEETGIADLRIDPVPVDLDIHRVEPPGEAPHDHLDVRYLVVAPTGSLPAGNHESEALRWVDLDDLARLGVDPGTLRLAHAGLARLRQSDPG
jgi:8-oxo-dGTP pyrophosphatase MutT (NUDIX family)